MIPPIEVSIPVAEPVASRLADSTLCQIEILPAGEEGPLRLDASTTAIIQGIPFLTVSEFIRAKLKTWIMYAVIVVFVFVHPLTRWIVQSSHGT